MLALELNAQKDRRNPTSETPQHWQEHMGGQKSAAPSWSNWSCSCDKVVVPDVRGGALCRQAAE